MRIKDILKSQKEAIQPAKKEVLGKNKFNGNFYFKKKIKNND